MTPALFAVAALATGAVSLFASAAWLRAASYCVLVVALLATWWRSTGHPRPVLIGVPSGTVAAFSLDEPRAIYIWLLPAGTRVPIAIALPWSERNAAALHHAARAARGLGTRLEMRGRANGAAGSRFPTLRAGVPRFYPAPNPPLAPKVRP